AGLAVAIVAWRRGFPQREQPRLPPGSGALAIVVVLAATALASGSIELVALFLPLIPATAGWFFGRAARIAAAACVPQVTPAAIGIVITGVILGVIFAGPLVAVTGGSGVRWGAGWTLVCAAVAGLYLFRAHIALPGDRERSIARSAAHAAGSSNDLGVAFQCEGVAVSFESTTVLRGADLQARGGELVALVGANGAGKSTLLRMAAGFVECRAGRVTVGGHDISMLRPEERAELGLTFVSGARPIFPDLTVLENLRVAAFRSHLGNRSFAAATEAIFDLAPALQARRRERAGVLSGGEQRLLAVAQTLYRRPIALLADELTLGLASDARIAVLDLLRLLADDGVAVVAVDHDLVSLLPRAHRAVLLSDGLARSFEDPVSLLDQRSSLLPATFLAQVPR
ncbi:MAG: ATP-binding cassette domain-containing protein, partial [Actinomycetota bacterium]